MCLVGWVCSLLPEVHGQKADRLKPGQPPSRPQRFPLLAGMKGSEATIRTDLSLHGAIVRQRGKLSDSIRVQGHPSKPCTFEAGAIISPNRIKVLAIHVEG